MTSSRAATQLNEFMPNANNSKKILCPYKLIGYDY